MKNVIDKVKELKLGGPAKLLIIIILILIITAANYTAKHITASITKQEPTQTTETEKTVDKPRLIEIECLPSNHGISTIDLGPSGIRRHEVEEGTRCEDLPEYQQPTAEQEVARIQREQEEREAQKEEERLAEIEEYLRQQAEAEEEPAEPKFYIYSKGNIERAENIDEILIIPDEIDGITVKSISPHVFKSMDIHEIQLPDTLEYIGNGAFKDNNIRHVDIPESVEIIDQKAFKNNEIQTLNLKNTKLIEYEAFMNNKILSLKIPATVERIDRDAFNDNHIGHIEFIDEGKLTSIRRGVFLNNNLTGPLYTPNSINHIHEQAFDNSVILTNYRHN